MQERVKILGVDIDNITSEEAGEITKQLIETSNKSCSLVVAPNVEFIMAAQKDEDFFNSEHELKMEQLNKLQKIYNDSRLVKLTNE